MTPTRRMAMVLSSVGLLALVLAPASGQQQGQPRVAAGGAQLPRAPQQQPGQPQGVFVPHAGPGRESEQTDAISLTVDRQAKKRIEFAEDYIKEEAWGEAAKALQSLLDAKEDLFLQVRRKGNDGKEVVRWTSVRAEANRLLGTLPEHGRQFYELQYGAQARRDLADARKKGDPYLLAGVVQRYFHTEAGAEAADLLGTYHLDHGQALMAALCYERLLFPETTAKPADAPRRKQAEMPLTLFKAALAFRRAGDAERAEQTWKQLASRAGREGLRVGDKTVALAVARAELERGTSARTVETTEVTLFRGGANRTAITRGSTPYLDTCIWQTSILPDRDKSAAAFGVLNAALARRLERIDALLPAFYPLAVNGKLVYRSYAGVHAVDARTGEVAWAMPAGGSLDALLSSAQSTSRVTYTNNWIQQYTSGNVNVYFENSTLGSLSSDGQRVYAVDDLAVPPPPGALTQFNGWAGQAINFGALQDAVHSSKLAAIDLETGKLAWELGGKFDKTDLKGSFFLGPPLPLGGKLYVLTEKSGELRLVCLDPPRDERGGPAVLWAQSLATVRNRLVADVLRRTQAVHLSYGDGILVCPTNAGAVLGIDLLSHSLIWAYSYLESTPSMPQAPQPGQIVGGMPGRMRGMPVLTVGAADWKGSAPVVQDGKVVFTAPDGTSVHCVNLRDGALLWKEPRKDDLYLAGVFKGRVVLVGKNAVRALALADGKPLWQVETGSLPSGLGAAAGDTYFVPLRKGTVCQIDLERGLLLPTGPGLKDEAPGNLVFYNGMVFTQNETGVAAYQQVEAKLTRADEALKNKPADPAALLERGELRLYQGDLAGAVADLRQALASGPPAEQAKKARDRLYESLTELLRRDWDAAEKYLADYRALCELPVPDNVSGEERRKLIEERRRRLENYHYLLASGYEKQGRVVDAFRSYLDYLAATGPELVSVLGESGTKVKAELWVQGRVAALLAKADAGQRQKLDAEIARRWDEVRGRGADEVRRYVALFGDLSGPGREARLVLAERLAETDDAVAAELHLLRLAGQADDPPLAARATDALARLLTRKGLLDDAAHFYRRLGEEFAGVAVRDGKTGADLFREVGTDPRFLPAFDEPTAVAKYVKNLQRQQLPGPQGINQTIARWPLPFESEGDRLPFLRQNRLGLVRQLPSAAMPQNGYQLVLYDRTTGDELWSKPLAAGPLHQILSMQPNQKTTYHVQGHVVVFLLGPNVFAFDLIERRVLWERSLLGKDGLSAVRQLHVEDDSVYVLNNDSGTMERLGQLGPVTASYVVLKTKQGLLALDPARGTELWVRADVPERAQVFGDRDKVYYVDVRDDGSAGPGRAVRGRDGATVDVPDFGPAYAKKLRVVSGRLLTSEADAKGSVTLRLYDVPTGKDVWKKVFAPGSVVLKSEAPELAGVVEPDGDATVVDLAGPREILQAKVERRHLDKVNDGTVLQDRGYTYLVLNRPVEALANNATAGPWANSSNLLCIPVHGTVYSFRREDGALNWYAEVPTQMLVLEQFDDLPMVLFTARYRKAVNPGQNFTETVATMSIAKATGKLVHGSEGTSSYQTQSMQAQFHTVRANPRQGWFDFISGPAVIRHYDAATGPGPPPPAAGPVPAPGFGRR